MIAPLTTAFFIAAALILGTGEVDWLVAALAGLGLGNQLAVTGSALTRPPEEEDDAY